MVRHQFVTFYNLHSGVYIHVFEVKYVLNMHYSLVQIQDKYHRSEYQSIKRIG